MEKQLFFIELGTAIIGLALLARVASRWGFSAVPLYLLAGLAIGKSGLLPAGVSQEFVRVGADIGIILLLFMLGLDYTGEELVANLRSGLPAGGLDLVLNFPPGLFAGLLLGWGPLESVLLGGVTYISSSGMIAKIFAEGREFTTPVRTVVISIAALEDLAMALYLPLVIVVLNRLAFPAAVLYALLPVAGVAAVLFLALRYGQAVSRLAAHQSDEVILLTSLGSVLLVAGIAQRLRVSEAVGAFLVGIAWSGPFAAHTRRVIEPLRDFFAALFFLFFGLQIDLASLPPVLWPALGLAGLTALTKILTGWWATRGRGIDVLGRLRAGAVLVARGEFSIVIAALAVGAGLNPALGALAAAYVLFQGILGPLLTRGMGPFARFARPGSAAADQ